MPTVRVDQEVADELYRRRRYDERNHNGVIRRALGEKEDGMAEQRILVNEVSFLLQEQQESGRYDVVAKGTIDRHGHVSVEPFTPWGAADELIADRRADMTEVLIDADLADWRATGPGDSELYAEEKLLGIVGSALAALPRDWQVIP